MKSTWRWGGSILSTGWGGVRYRNFHLIICLSQVRHFVLSSDKLLSTVFWVMWEKACFYW